MKLIKRLWNPVTVDYFGLLMPVPSDIKFLATDETGTLFGFKNKPKINKSLGIWQSDSIDIDFETLANVNLEGKDWRDSLVTL